MKKYIYLGIVGVLLSIAIALGVWKFGFFTDKKIFKYIPSQFGLVYYYNIDNNIKDSIDKLPIGAFSGDYKKVLSKINQIAVYQSADGKYSFLIIKAEKGFDIKEAFEAGFFNKNNNNITKDLGNGIIAYGDSESVEFISKYSGETIYDMPKFKDYIVKLSNGQRNIGIFSKIDTTEINETNALAKEYGGYLDYLVITSKLSNKGIDGNMQILLKKDITLNPNYKFSNSLSTYFDKSHLLFLQVGSLQSLIGFSDIFKLLIQDGIDKQSLFKIPDEDIQNISSIFDGNTAIILTDGENVFGLGAAMIFETTKLYDIINKYFPLLKAYVSMSPELSGFVSDISSGESLGLRVMVPTTDFTSLPLDINIQKDDGKTVLKLFNPKLKKQNQTLDSNSKSIANFYVNFNKIIDIYTRFSAFTNMQSNISNLDFFKDKTLKGNVYFSSNSISLDFNLE